MISSYLPLHKPSTDLVANELMSENIRLTKETRFIEKNTMDVILQSSRRASKISPPKIPDKIHVKNYKTVLNELFSFACDLRFALAPYLMITTPNYASILVKHDSAILIKALRPVINLTQKYIRSLSLKLKAAHYHIYIQGQRFQEEKQLLFSVIFRCHEEPKTTKDLRQVFENLFDCCALPPDLYKIYTANEFIRRGYYLRFPKNEDISPIVILLDQAGFPVSNFPRGWEVVRAHRNVYYTTQLSDNVCLSTANSINLSSIK